MPENIAAQALPTLLVPSPVEEVHNELLDSCRVRLWLKRDDLIHPELPGNKWRKLEHNLRAARDGGFKTLLTFGGAYSNHIRAAAAAGHYFGFDTIGVIRGEQHLPLNPSLAYAVSRGMKLAYLDRAAYRQKRRPELVEALHRVFGDFYLVPEGGSNELGVRGCAAIPEEIDVPFDVICCACGTGATLAGIAAGLASSERAIGFAALKGGEFLARDIEDLQVRTFGHRTGNWTLNTAFHFGGFARKTEELDRFIEEAKRRYGLLFDWVYVAKMLYGVLALIERGEIAQGQNVVAVITG